MAREISTSGAVGVALRLRVNQERAKRALTVAEQGSEGLLFTA